MPFVVTCPTCRQSLTVHEESAGQQVACPHCRYPLTVPAVTAPRWESEPEPDESDSSPTPASRRKNSSGNSLVLVAVLGAVFLTVCAVGAGVYFASRSTEAKGEKAAPSEDRAKVVPTPKAKAADQKSAVKLKEVGSGAEESEWRAVVEAELEQARARKRVAEPVKGAMMTTAEYQVAVENIPAFQSIFTINEPRLYNLSIGPAVIEMQFPACAVLPETCRVLRREVFAQYANRPTDELDRLATLVPAFRPLLDESFRKRMMARLPSSERKTLHAKFVAITGDTEAWSLLHPFDELDGAEMKAAIAAVERMRESGLRALTSEERRLLIRAGAVEFIQRSFR